MCYEFDRPEYIRALLELFKESNVDESGYSVGVMIVCNLAMSREYLEWLSNAGLDLVGVIEEAITADTIDETVYGVRLCLEVGRFDLNTLQELKSEALDSSNNKLLWEIAHAIGTHPDQAFAPLPTYLTNTQNKTLRQLIRDLPPPHGVDMTLDELAIASAWQHKIEGNIEKFDEVKEETYQFLLTLSSEQVQEFADAHFDSSQSDLQVNRVIGPVNPIDSNLTVDDEYLLRIPFDRAALRKPRLGGGWMGCYCSFDCMRKSIAQNSYYTLNFRDAEATNGDVAGEESTKIYENQMIDQLEQVLNRDGVELPLNPEDGPAIIDEPDEDDLENDEEFRHTGTVDELD